jgi:hypothetical protein
MPPSSYRAHAHAREAAGGTSTPSTPGDNGAWSHGGIFGEAVCRAIDMWSVIAENDAQPDRSYRDCSRSHRRSTEEILRSPKDMATEFTSLTAGPETRWASVGRALAASWRAFVEASKIEIEEGTFVAMSWCGPGAFLPRQRIPQDR